jgi:hypothetical protein
MKELDLVAQASACEFLLVSAQEDLLWSLWGWLAACGGLLTRLLVVELLPCGAGSPACRRLSGGAP